MAEPPPGRLSSSSTRPAVSAHAQWASQPYSKVTNKCQEPRPLWPDIDAAVQLFFRVSCVFLNVASLLMVLVTQQNLMFWPVWTLLALFYGLVLNIIEIVCLTAPPFPPFHKFPRLPSAWLAGFDTSSIVMIAWSESMLLIPNVWRQGGQQGGHSTVIFLDKCPPESCTTQEERRAVAIFGMGILTGIFHIGFVIMSLSHILKRTVPNWLDNWTSNWDFLD